MSEQENNKALLGLTAEIVAAHVKNNTVTAADLPPLIEQVYAALRDAGRPQAAPPQPAARPEAERPSPVVSPKKSVFPDYIICLEDGRKLKTLKRHLRSTYNMTPEQYREKWELPPDYPMVAPNYAEHRSVLAKQLGLGRKPAVKAEPAPARAAEPPKPPVPAEPQAVREAPPEPPRPARTDHTAASVFAKFPGRTEPEAPPPSDPNTRKSGRKPFSKQLARTMRP